MFDGIWDYIVVYYYLNICDDFVYWVVCCEDLKVLDIFFYLLNVWDKGVSFEYVFNEVDNKLVYLWFLWYCIFVGMKCFFNNIMLFV